MGAEVIIPLALMAAGTAVQYENTRRTEKRQDNELAGSIRRQGEKQRKADQRVDEEVKALETSTAADERKQRLTDYMGTIQKSQGKLTAGLTPGIGGDAFKADSAQAAADVGQYAADNAGLYARIDAPGMQRMGEGFGFGNLATDIGLIGRESQGQSFIDELRLRNIRRNPWMDLAGSTMTGLAGAYGGTGAGGGVGTNPGTKSTANIKTGGGIKTNAFRKN